MAKKSNKNSKSAVTAAKPKIIEPIVPASIAELTGLAKSIAGVKDIPENMLAVQKRLADGCTKLAERITKGLGATAKKAERDARAKEREAKKADREKAKNDKKLAKVAKLREQLKAAEAELPPTRSN